MSDFETSCTAIALNIFHTFSNLVLSRNQTGKAAVQGLERFLTCAGPMPGCLLWGTDPAGLSVFPQLPGCPQPGDPAGGDPGAAGGAASQEARSPELRPVGETTTLPITSTLWCGLGCSVSMHTMECRGRLCNTTFADFLSKSVEVSSSRCTRSQ